MTGSHCYLAFLIASLLLSSAYSSRSSFESGIRTLIIQRETTSMVNNGSSLPFTILFQKQYSMPPLALLSPLTFTRSKEKAFSDVWGRVRLVSTIIKKNKMGVMVSSTTKILSVRCSYLFVERQVTNSLGFYILDQLQQDQNERSLTTQKKQMATIKEIAYLGQQRSSKSNQRMVPFFKDCYNYQFYLLAKEINFNQNGPTSYNMSLLIKYNMIQVTFISNYGENSYLDSQFPQYSILTYKDFHRQVEISFEKVSFSTPTHYFSSKISSGQSIFMGLTAFSLNLSTQIEALDFAKINDHYFIVKDVDTQGTADLDIALITIIPREKVSLQSYQHSRLLLTCNSPTYLTTYIDYWLTWVDPVNTTMQSCQPCPTGCYKCYYCNSCLHFVNCSLCLSGFNLVKLGIATYPNSQRVCTCPSQTFPDSVTQTCKACSDIISNCASCVIDSSGHFGATCATCNSSYFGTSTINSTSTTGYTTCSPCTYGCKICSGSATNCSTCASGFTKVGGLCVCSTAGTYYSQFTKTCQTCGTIYPNCVACVSSAGITNCTTCAGGYYLSSTGFCVACSTYCLNCTATACITCKSTFNLSGTSCVCSTSPQYLLNTVTSTCVSCTGTISLCINCTISGSTLSCTTCSSGSFLSTSTSCTLCLTTCSTCTSLLVCQTCVNNLLLINNQCTCDTNLTGNYLNVLTNTCISCSQTYPQCTSCTTAPITLALVCATCDNGTYLSNGSCLACPFTCTACTGSTTCVTCVTGYQLNTTTYLCECIDCTNCNSLLVYNCALCDLTTPGSYFCITCTTGYYISNGTCLVCSLQCATCTSSTACQTCNSPFIPSTPAGSCVCNSLSLLYYNPTGPTCSSCATIYGVNCTSCSSSFNSTVCLTCTSGNYVNSGLCTVCPYPCATCTSALICNSCYTTFSLINNTCSCDPVYQYYLNTAVVPNVCDTCSYLTTSICLGCTPNALSTSYSGVACTSCPDGYFPDPVTFLCSICSTTCTVCSSSTSCSQCVSTYSLIGTLCACDTANGIFQYGSVCLVCYSIINYCKTCAYSLGAVVCTACGTGTYLNGGICTLCPVNCAVCTSLVCTTCIDGYLPDVNGVCICSTSCGVYNTADPSCVNCALSPPDAVTALSTLLCNACVSSTFLVSQLTCNACPSTCASCKDYVTCLTCQPSFTLINNNCECNADANDISYSSLCYNCVELKTNCLSCNLMSGVPHCNTCLDGYGIELGSCFNCGLGCKQCTVVGGIVTGCTACYTPSYFLSSGSCIQVTTCNNLAAVYDDGVTPCNSCMDYCQVCYDISSCVICEPSFKYIKEKCVCNEGLGMFLDKSYPGGPQCIPCQSAVSGGVSYLINCKICQASSVNYNTTGIQCLECIDGYYQNLGTCSPCMNGCQKCNTGATCCSCMAPSWIMNTSICVCNNDLNYFTNGMSSCLPCTLANCTVCDTLLTCKVCNIDSFVNGLGVCQLSVCGNSVLEGIEGCDDGNTLAGDGCSTTCTVELYYYCVNTVMPSVCALDSRFKIKLTEILSECNKITFKFQIYPFYDYYEAANFDRFLYINTFNASSTFQSYTRSSDIISYTFSIKATLQSQAGSFTFDPSNLQINQTIGYPTNSVAISIEPTNNVPAIFYQADVCKSASSLKKVASVIEYGSYATMILSALPSKIVGLELTGVVQLALFSLGSIDHVNIMMSPMMGMKGINGYAIKMGQDPSKSRLLQTQTLTPTRINSIGYESNFLRNCNLMLLLIITVILVGFSLYSIASCLDSCPPTFIKVSKRLIKEVLLTLILFNCLNFAYSAGIHFRYAIPEDSLYQLGTLAAVTTLVIPVLMAIGLSKAEEDGFGQFKDKLKTGCIEKAYFVVTIIYRMCLGLYMSTSNQDQLSTLIVMSVSILFILYNLVNLPFTKAYHNYRANICHFCQFIILFVAMYYRSMRSTSSITQVSGIFSPVYLQYSCIMVSLVVSFAVLVYDAYIWIKDCCTEWENQNMRQRAGSNISEAENKLNHNNTITSLQVESNEKEGNIEIPDDLQAYN